jgi:hypothetical protein
VVGAALDDDLAGPSTTSLSLSTSTISPSITTA